MSTPGPVLPQPEPAVPGPTAPERLILVGNPNVGKSVWFKNLTQRYVTVSNYPGTTVELVRAQAEIGGRDVEVIDTPGINDLTDAVPDAEVTRRVVMTQDDAVLVQIADAKNLKRALLLTLQLAETGRPMVLVLNMFDELDERGGHIDTRALERRLGIPIVTAVAVRNEGTEALVRALARARAPHVQVAGLEGLEGEYPRNRARLRHADEILEDSFSLRQPPAPSFRVRLGFWAMDPIKGLALLAVVLLFVFWFVGLFGAGTMVDLLEIGVFQQRLSPLAIGAVDWLLPFPHTHARETLEAAVALPLTPVHEVPIISFVRTVAVPAYELGPGAETWQSAAMRLPHDFLVGEFGVITMAVSYAFAIVLPIVVTFFLVFSILEDSGYLPRLAVMVNRVFRIMGLNGKAVLPMVLGLGCDTMATMTTRILETRKERIVTTMLLALAVPCSAQLGVLMAMMTRLSLAAALTWLALMIGIMLLVGGLTARRFEGESSGLLLEIPPLRRPQIDNVWSKTRGRIRWYLREVIPLFVIGTALLFVFDAVGALPRIAAAGEPLVRGWLGLPPETANAFLVGFLRRDFGAVYLLDAAVGPAAILTPLQVFVAMLTLTLFMPCIANFLIIVREHGTRVAIGIAAFVFPFAFLLGGIASRVGTWLGAI